MKIKIGLFSLFCLVFFCNTILASSSVLFNVNKIEAPFLSSPITLDGDLSEWKSLTPTGVCKKYNFDSGAIKDDNDLSAVVYFAWDRENLYFAAKVKDNQVLQGETSVDIWKDDCIELFVDPAYDGLKWGDPMDFQIGFPAPAEGKNQTAWAWFQKKDPGTNIKFVSVKCKDGYIVEAAIKWKFLNIVPEEGMYFGISPAFHDKDTDDSPNGKLNWYYNKGIFGMMGKIFLVQAQTGKDNRNIENIFSMKNIRSVTPQDYYDGMVKERKGMYPRWLSREQAYWTIAGADEDENEALFCEDGSIEPFKRGFSILPFLFKDGVFITRENAVITQSLEKSFLPIPSVDWNADGLKMNIRMFVDGTKSNSSAIVIYNVKNDTDRDMSGKLILAILPFQIYPPWQGGGGLSPIKDIDFQKNIVEINKKYKVQLSDTPDRFGVKDGQFKTGPDFDGDIIQDIWTGPLSQTTHVSESNGFASAGMEYDLKLKPCEERKIYLVIPLNGQKTGAEIGGSELENRLNKDSQYWGSKLGDIRIDIPEKKIADVMKANVLYNLITRDGAGFQPGSRSYDKTWMRDGSIAANAMLEMGFSKEVKDFIQWYGQFQFTSGEIPPIIDTKAKDFLWEEKQNGLIEYDSQGEYVWIMCQYYKYTKDIEFLRSQSGKITQALKFLETLRKKRLTDEFNTDNPDKRRFYGILPPSTSHEGYSSAHSYWDDFWALKGWKDGRYLSEAVGQKDLVKWQTAEYEGLKGSLYSSINTVALLKNKNYISGCADLGDFDATSTAIAIIYCDELDNLPQDKLKNTFDRYYTEITDRFKKNAKFRFTPYEVRSVTAFIEMGQKQRALDLLRFIINSGRPSGFQVIAEAVDSDYRLADYFGDMPHTWVGAEYVHAVRSLFVYEKNNSLVLGAGIDEKWVEAKEGVSIENLPTEFGKISYTVRKAGAVVRIMITGDAAPDKGFVFISPLTGKKIQKAKVNGEELADSKLTNGIPVDKLPCEIELRY